MIKNLSLFRSAILGVFALAAVVVARAADRPDIVVFLADDLSIEDCPPYGAKDMPTPNLQALADEGMAFERAYVASPSCAPSRAALLSGMYGLRNGATFNHQPISPDVRKWPSYFQELGYEVVALGKVAHYNQVREYGFDYSDFSGFHQNECIEETVKWLSKRKSDKPLCLLVGTNWPHTPWPAKGQLDPKVLTLSEDMIDTPETRAERARYMAAVANMDRDLGLVRDAVKQYLPKDTVFFFSSDHGARFPFRKWNLYEAGIRVPFIVSWPGVIEKGSRSEAMVSWLDIMPTALEAAGTDPIETAPGIDGRSFMSVLKGESDEHRSLIFTTHSGDGNFNFYPARSVRAGDWKYIRNVDPDLEYHSHIDLKDDNQPFWQSWERAAKEDAFAASLVERYGHRPAEELYNLAVDPYEMHNLAEDPNYAGELTILGAAVDEWMVSLADEGMDTEFEHKPGQEKKGKKKKQG